MSMHPEECRTAPADPVVWLDGEPLAIRVSLGVHAPSSFTQALVTALPRVDGLDVVDAGCGAGSVTVALLRRGAAHVTASDIVPAALADTLENAGRHADAARVTPLPGSWEVLAGVGADLLVTNPPQCPRAVWEQLAPEEHAAGAGGEDGLEALAAILTATRAPRVIASISTLTTTDLAPLAARCGFTRTQVLADELVTHDAIWRCAGSLESARVRVWELART
jgi:methylase of polypeptide subunit release factors